RRCNGGIRGTLTEPTSVNQHQRAVRTEPAQVRGRDTARSGEAAGAVAQVLTQVVVKDLRELIQNIGNVVLACSLNFLGAPDLDRARARGIRRSDARSGDDDLLDLD